jgi:hypothetical protein
MEAPVMCPPHSSTCAAAAPRHTGTLGATLGGAQLTLELDAGEPVRVALERYEILPPPADLTRVRYELAAAAGEVGRAGAEVTLEGEAVRTPGGGAFRMVLSWRPSGRGVVTSGFLSLPEDFVDLSGELVP